jgi:hypothetical protein
LLIERAFVYGGRYFPRLIESCPVGVDVSSVLSSARALHAALQDFDPALSSGGECALLVAEFARAEKALAAARAVTAARAVACGAHVTNGRVTTPREWLARQMGVPAGQAQAELDTAVLAASLADTRDAMRRGDLSLAAVGEVVRTEQVAPGSEGEQLAAALREPLHVLRDQARRRRLDVLPIEELRARQRRARGVRQWRDELGMFRLDATLLPEDGVALVSRLEAEADRLWRGDATSRVDTRERRRPTPSSSSSPLAARVLAVGPIWWSWSTAASSWTATRPMGPVM